MVIVAVVMIVVAIVAAMTRIVIGNDNTNKRLLGYFYVLYTL